MGNNRAKVLLDFKDIYDSSSIMVMQDDSHWAKACFELTDFGTHTVVRNCLEITHDNDLYKCPYAASDNLGVARYAKIVFFADEHLYDILVTSYFWTVPKRCHERGFR